MASQVLSGSSNPSYTNNTGQNVRVVINFMASVTSISWAGVSATASSCTIGRNLAFSNREVVLGTSGTTSQPLAGQGDFTVVSVSGASASVGVAAVNCLSGGTADMALPTELMLASGQTFSATCGAYNIVVIPEAG
jgi:hypothetical protein